MTFANIPGFDGAVEILHEKQNPDEHFLFSGNLRLVFFEVHLDISAGDTVQALDLTGPRFVRLSPNWAAPIPLPGESAFLTFTENRYVPIPGSKKTANCSYMEHWNQKLSKIRYARDKSHVQIVRFSCADEIEVIRCRELKWEATQWDIDIGVIVVVECVTCTIAIGSGSRNEIIPVDVVNPVVVDPFVEDEKAVACPEYCYLKIGALRRR